MKIFDWTFGFEEIVYFINNQSVSRKRFIMGEYSTDKYIWVTELVLKNWTDGNQTLNDIIGESFLILFVPQSVTTFCNDERNGIPLARQRTFSTKSPLMPILMNLLTKRFFQMLVCRVWPAMIVCPIMMELMFSCLTWKQWLRWMLGQLLL